MFAGHADANGVEVVQAPGTNVGTLAQDAWHGLAYVLPPLPHVAESERTHVQLVDADGGAGGAAADGAAADCPGNVGAALIAAIVSAQHRGTAVMPLPRHRGAVVDQSFGRAGAAM